MTYWTKITDLISWAFGARARYQLRDVFTSGSPADVNYVRRPQLEDFLKSNLQIKGKQIALFGHSGSGKTTLVRKILKEQNREFICTPCSQDSKFDDLLLSAFDDLNPYYIEGGSKTNTFKLGKSVQSEYMGIKGSITSERVDTTSVQIKRVLPIQLNPRKLSTFLGEAKCCWIIEDFHKLSSVEKQKLADCLKIFVDQGDIYPDMKIICIGIVGSVQELLQYDTNLNTRVAEIEIPLLSDDENRKLINNGCELLHVKMEDKMINDIISYSNRIGSVAHQMCYDICHKNGINETNCHERFLPYEKFADALQSYIEAQSDRLHYLYEGAIRADVGWHILRILSNTGRDKVSLTGIVKGVNQNRRNQQFKEKSVEEKLQELSLPEIGIVKYDANADKYSLSSPFWGAFIKMQQRLEYNKSQKKKKTLIENQQGISAILYNMLLHELKRMQQM